MLEQNRPKVKDGKGDRMQGLVRTTNTIFGNRSLLIYKTY